MRQLCRHGSDDGNRGCGARVDGALSEQVERSDTEHAQQDVQVQTIVRGRGLLLGTRAKSMMMLLTSVALLLG